MSDAIRRIPTRRVTAMTGGGGGEGMWRVVVHKRNGLFRLILARFRYKADAEMFLRRFGNMKYARIEEERGNERL